MRRFKAVVTCVFAAVVTTPGSVAAQEAGPSLDISASFEHVEDVSMRRGWFAFGEPIAAYLHIANTGADTATGVSATLSFARGNVQASTASYLDIPAGGTGTNAEPFLFSYGERQVRPEDPWEWSECFIDLIADPPDDEVIDEPLEGIDEVIVVDDPFYSSDDYKAIPPGRLIFTVTSDQGEVVYRHEWVARCYMVRVLAGHAIPAMPSAPVDGTGRGSLAATGSRQVVALDGLLFLLGGIAIRARAGSMAARPERRWDAP